MPGAALALLAAAAAYCAMTELRRAAKTGQLDAQAVDEVLTAAADR